MTNDFFVTELKDVDVGDSGLQFYLYNKSESLSIKNNNFYAIYFFLLLEKKTILKAFIVIHKNGGSFFNF